MAEKSERPGAEPPAEDRSEIGTRSESETFAEACRNGESSGNAEASVALGILSLILVVFSWSLGFPQNTWGAEVFWVVTLVGVLSMLGAVCLGLISFVHGRRVRREQSGRLSAAAFVLGFVSLIISGAMLLLYLIFLVLSAI